MRKRGILALCGLLALAIAVTQVDARGNEIFGRAHGSGHGGHFGRMCQDHGSWWVGLFGAYLKRDLALDKGQRAAANRLSAALKNGNSVFSKVCADADTATNRNAAPAQFARAEKAARAGLDWIRIVGPALDDFYATLSPQQKIRFDTMMSHRRRGRRHD